MFKKIITWQDPLETAYFLSESGYSQNWIFLYSGLNQYDKRSRSYLAFYPQQEIVSENFHEFDQIYQRSLENKERNHFFGYFGYDLKNDLEQLPFDKKSFINLPNLWMINFAIVLEFDHSQHKIICHYGNKHFLAELPGALKLKASNSPLVKKIRSNFSKKQYLQKVDNIRNHIKEGDIYQANLTRKFFGKLHKKFTNQFELFLKLNQQSPANYSAFLKLGNKAIISSSPELFLMIDKNNHVLSSPIKGTARRSKNNFLDNKYKEALQNSVKEKAENLMIVDLVRNDFSRNCLHNSVSVKNLFAVSSYSNVHHMFSDVCGVKDPRYSHFDLLKSCFPPGSMTGAPKIKAMEICSDLEKNRRGVYSGAIGYFWERECKFSVTIRTIILEGDKFEFQVGGAITFDSKPLNEWQETINKARGIAKTLRVKITDLKKI